MEKVETPTKNEENSNLENTVEEDRSPRSNGSNTNNVTITDTNGKQTIR
jgi:hypothetical protein